MAASPPSIQCTRLVGTESLSFLSLQGTPPDMPVFTEQMVTAGLGGQGSWGSGRKGSLDHGHVPRSRSSRNSWTR